MPRPVPGLIVALLALLTPALRADDRPLTRQVGQRPGTFSALDVASGRTTGLDALKGEKGTVLVFLGIDCPVGNQYVPRLVEIAKSYGPKGITVVGLNSNASEPAAKIAQHAKEFGINFPVLRDDGAKVADLYQADRTCEAILLDREGTVRYRGAIDDAFGYGTRRPKAVRSYLTEAIDALLSGNGIETTGTTVVGCPIERPDRPSSALNIPKVRAAAPAIQKQYADEPAVKVGEVTYAADVAAILQNRCQNCHRPKAAAPFSLLSYDDARRWAASIREVVDERRMPPWHADPRYGHFSNDRRLSPEERATLIAWVDAGTPLGDPKAIPPAKTFPEGWGVGQPDVVVEMPQEYTVPADGVVSYQYFRVPLNFTEDKWVQSIECMPGDRAVVHHIIAYLQEKKPRGEGREPEHLGGYAPGELPCVYEPGIAKKIPAGSEILLQVHYTPMGKIRKDRSKVGLIFAKEPPKHEAHTRGIVNMGFRIPPGDANYEVKSRFKFGQDSHLLSFMPHMHLRGKDFEYRVIYPGKEPQTLLSVPAYDFAWQSYYRLTEPLAMPKGTVIECIAHFDNSEGNPANPDPKSEVKWGDQTFEEMMIGYIDFYRDAPITADAPEPKDEKRSAGRAIGSRAGASAASLKRP